MKFSRKRYPFHLNCRKQNHEKKFHVLHIVQCAGGVDCYLRMLFANMNKSEYSNTLVCSFDYNPSDYEGLVEECIQVDMRNALSLSMDTVAVREVRRLIKQIKPDIIYCHSSKGGGVGRLANIGTGIPIVYNPHGWAFSMEGSKVKSLIYLWLEWCLSPFTTKFVTISNYEKLIAVQKHVAKLGKIKTIFNGIDMEDVERQLAESTVTRETLGIPADACVIGMVGRISAQKAPDTFVRMAAKVKESIPNAWFIIVGDGDEREATEQLIAENALSDCFTITGWVSNPIAYSALFDIAVLLSRWEGFGLVLAEYMKLGKPIVATETNAIPDLIIDHENGLLVNVDDYEQATQAVMEIYSDEALRNDMIEKGRVRADALFDVRRTAREHERLFTKTLRGGVNYEVIIISMPVGLPSFVSPIEWRATA